MKKLIVIHSESEQLLYDFSKKFTHHISCPKLMFITPPDGADANEMFQVTEVVEGGIECGCLFMVNSPIVSDKVEDYYKRFDVFNIFTDTAKFYNHQDHHGVWLGTSEEIDFAFNQIIGWVYDV